MAPLPTPGYPTATATPTLNSPKVLGGLGCVFLFLTFAPSVGGLLGVVGIVMVGYALYRISEVVGERRIFTNFLYAALTAVVGLAVGVSVAITGVLQVLGFENLATNDWAGFRPTAGEGLQMAVSLFGGLLIMWVALIVSAVFVKRASDLVADRLRISHFRTAGLIYLIGAALTVVAVGFIVLAIALLIFAVGFFTIPDRAPQPVAPTMPGGAA